jgi:hypothetical protein
MSYDLRLVRPNPGKGPVRSAKAILTATNRPPRHPNWARQQEKRRLARVLLATFPDLHASRDVTVTADAQPGSAPPWAGSRAIELYGGADDPITISLDDYTAAVSIAFWHTGAEAAAVLERVRAYLEVLQREGQFEVYDPQQERFLDIAQDLPAIQRIMDGIPTPRGGIQTIHLD